MPKITEGVDIGALADDDALPVGRVGLVQHNKTTPSAIKAYLTAENAFDPYGEAASELASHLMELDPHTQYLLNTEQVDLPNKPLTDGLWALRIIGGVATWEILTEAL